jgi:ketosteroid isomerase-like protein
MAVENAEPMEKLALKMMRAAQAGDMETVRDCYTADATLWLNVTGRTLKADDHIASIKAMRGRVNNLRYEDIQVKPFDGGYVQQHMVYGDLPDGGKFEVAACFVVQVRDGKIAHREEYIDSASIAPVLG